MKLADSDSRHQACEQQAKSDKMKIIIIAIIIMLLKPRDRKYKDIGGVLKIGDREVEEGDGHTFTDG